jgi:magnesium-transporting ATPase (P-type)
MSSKRKTVGLNLKIKSHSLAATISPLWITTNFIAVAFAGLGILLRTLLELAREQPTKELIIETIFSTQMILHFASAAITAILFYNIYEWTELGKRLNRGAGSQSAVIIGVLSGILNEKVVPALEELLG